MWLIFFQILPLVFDLFGIGLHGFSIYNASNLMTRGTSFKCYYSYEFFFFLIIFCDFIILNYLKNNCGYLYILFYQVVSVSLPKPRVLQTVFG